MTLLEINDQFQTVTDAVTGLNGYSFGWPSDRMRSQTYAEPGEDQTSLFPRVLFAVPEMTQDVVGQNDAYQCRVFFDDLLGYDDAGQVDERTQAEKWDNLHQLASRWVKAMQDYRTTGHIEGDVSYTLDSFEGIQRLVSVVISFTFVTKSVC